jgi:hypothetical protein
VFLSGQDSDRVAVRIAEQIVIGVVRLTKISVHTRPIRGGSDKAPFHLDQLGIDLQSVQRGFFTGSPFLAPATTEPSRQSPPAAPET